MIFKELHKNVFHVKNVFSTEMFLRVRDEFNPINNHWTFDKESSYDDGNSSIRGKIVKSSSFIGDNLTLIGIYFSGDLTLKSGNSTINKSTTNVMMEVFTVKEYQDRWDELMERVENGETFGIVNENGQAAVMMPADDETIRIYTENNNEAP